MRSLFSTSPNLAATAATMRRGTRDSASLSERIKRCFLLISRSRTFSRADEEVTLCTNIYINRRCEIMKTGLVDLVLKAGYPRFMLTKVGADSAC